MTAGERRMERMFLVTMAALGESPTMCIEAGEHLGLPELAHALFGGDAEARRIRLTEHLVELGWALETLARWS